MEEEHMFHTKALLPVLLVRGRQVLRPVLQDHPEHFFTSKVKTKGWSDSPTLAAEDTLASRPTEQALCQAKAGRPQEENFRPSQTECFWHDKTEKWVSFGFTESWVGISTLPIRDGRNSRMELAVESADSASCLGRAESRETGKVSRQLGVRCSRRWSRGRNK